jgi:predicted membrane protein
VSGADDPVLVRRAKVARLVELGQRVGYGLFGFAIVAFVFGWVRGYTDTLTTLIIAALLVGSVILAPAIVFGYAVKAADRDDREHGRLPPKP